MVSRTSKAYLAGVLDGEGSIGIDNHGGLRTPSVRITITNTNLNLLATLQTKWGGNLASWRKREKGWKACSDLIWGGRPATDRVLKAALPYLVVKKEQAKIALEFNKTVLKHNTRRISSDVHAYRQELRKQMLELNKRGSMQST